MPNVGDPILASQFGFLAPWQSWVPALTATTTNPTLGTGGGTAGTYALIGKTLIAHGLITFGTASTSAGSGSYIISTPVNITGTFQTICGTARLKSAGGYTYASLEVSTNTSVLISYLSAAVGGTRNLAANAAPGAWTANDSIDFTIIAQAQ